MANSVRRFKPLKILNEDDGGDLVIDTVESAIKYVTGFWPVRNGEAYEEVLQACIDGMNDRVSPEQVRQTLLRAAKEAGISVVE